MHNIKILSIGNSFSVDTMEFIAEISKSLGINCFKFANLYIGGCSINRHYINAMNDISEYVYYTNIGNGWDRTDHYSIGKAIKEEKWDIISIQHGTGDKSRYTSEDSYKNLKPLIQFVKSLTQADTKITFNMAWVAEPESTHHEITSYGGDQLLMYKKLTELTKNLIASMSEIYTVSPVGTAIQNARTCIDKKLTRDNFHLSYDLGRYIAGLTFFKALCDLDINTVAWKPEGVTKYEKEMAIKAANSAVENPYVITKL